jgi:hypothetical protein
MGSKPILLPFDKSDIYDESHDWTELRNRFSGTALFKTSLYSLLTGNLSVLEKTDNKWFYEELFRYAERTLDINFLPVLKKLSSGSRFGESLQQRATELMEIIEGKSAKGINGTHSSSLNGEYSRAEIARRTLAGTRSPQTTEILRLIRDKSHELKQLALCLIGKFKITDMTQEVCECLNIPGLESDAISVLSGFGDEAGKEINRFYLISSGNINTSKTILRLYSHLCPKSEMQFLIGRLSTNSRPVKEISLNSLLRCGYEPDEKEKSNLKKQISETFGLLAWIISARICLYDNNDMVLLSLLEKEYKRWNVFLLDLLILTYGKSIIPVSKGEIKPDDLNRKIPDLAEIIYTNNPKKQDASDIETDRKKLKKLQKYFPCTVPQYQALLEDIINCDYNLINVWTKASAIRNITEFDDEHIRESVIAVLFSHEWILKEEAARLISVRDHDLYTKITERLPEQDLMRLYKIMDKSSNDADLLYEKVKFLSSFFPDIIEDELIFIAERTNYLRNGDPELTQILKGSVVWALTSGKQVFKTAVIHDNDNVNYFLDNMEHSDSFFYVIKLNAVELFRFYYPGSSFRVYKYIDGLEE